MRDEILTAARLRWALITWPLVTLVSIWARPISAGVLLLALVGFRLIGVTLWEGLYALSRDDEDEEGS